jgi:hypothetical protein
VEDDLAFSDEPELIARDALDGRRIVAQVADLEAKPRDLATKLGVLAVDVGELVLDRAKTRQPFGLEDEHRNRDERERQDRDWKRSLK